MTIFLDDILNLEFTTNLRRGIPVSVKTKGQKGSFRHQGRRGKRCTKCGVCEKGLTATKRGKNDRDSLLVFNVLITRRSVSLVFNRYQRTSK